MMVVWLTSSGRWVEILPPDSTIASANYGQHGSPAGWVGWGHHLIGWGFPAKLVVGASLLASNHLFSVMAHLVTT